MRTEGSLQPNQGTSARVGAGRLGLWVVVVGVLAGLAGAGLMHLLGWTERHA